MDPLDEAAILEVVALQRINNPGLAFLPPSTTSEFTTFSRLPGELQAEIWQLALPPPTSITIRAKTSNDETSGLFAASQNSNLMSLLHACFSSRSAALQNYKLFDLTQDWLEHPFYYDPTRDLINCDTVPALESLMRAFDPATRSDHAIQIAPTRIAVLAGLESLVFELNSESTSITAIMKMLSWLPDLKSFSFSWPGVHTEADEELESRLQKTTWNGIQSTIRERASRGLKMPLVIYIRFQYCSLLHAIDAQRQGVIWAAIEPGHVRIIEDNIYDSIDAFEDWE